MAGVLGRERTYSTTCARAPASTCTVITVLNISVKRLLPCVPKLGTLGMLHRGEESHLVREDHWGVDGQSRVVIINCIFQPRDALHSLHVICTFTSWQCVCTHASGAPSGMRGRPCQTDMVDARTSIHAEHALFGLKEGCKEGLN